MENDNVTPELAAAQQAGGTGRKPRILAESRAESAIVILLGASLFLALPFVLKAGALVFFPLTLAFVLSVALSPLADWFGRFRIPNGLASLGAVLALLMLLGFAASLVVQPAIQLIGDVPALSERIARRLEDMAGNFRQIEILLNRFEQLGTEESQREVVLASPSFIEQIAYATPQALVETLMSIVLTYFMIESRLRTKRKLLLERSDFKATLRAARGFSTIQTQLSAYVTTTLGIAFAMGVIVGCGAFAFGWPSPIMWGGLAALLNLIPYLGPLIMVLLISLVGLGGEGSIIAALAPAGSYLLLNTLEANVVTPAIMGRRLSVSPLAVLVSISYFGWIWGIAGALISVPLLLIVVVLFQHLGSPNAIGFLFGEPLFNPPDTA